MPCFSGALAAGVFHTSPLMVICLVRGFVIGDSDRLGKGPSAAALYPTVMLVSPFTGISLSLSHLGVVQPQLACTLLILIGSLLALPNFENMCDWLAQWDLYRNRMIPLSGSAFPVSWLQLLPP